MMVMCQCVCHKGRRILCEPSPPVNFYHGDCGCEVISNCPPAWVLWLPDREDGRCAWPWRSFSQRSQGREMLQPSVAGRADGLLCKERCFPPVRGIQRPKLISRPDVPSKLIDRSSFFRAPEFQSLGPAFSVAIPAWPAGIHSESSRSQVASDLAPSAFQLSRLPPQT